MLDERQLRQPVAAVEAALGIRGAVRRPGRYRGGEEHEGEGGGEALH